MVRRWSSDEVTLECYPKLLSGNEAPETGDWRSARFGKAGKWRYGISAPVNILLCRRSLSQKDKFFKNYDC